MEFDNPAYEGVFFPDQEAAGAFRAAKSAAMMEEYLSAGKDGRARTDKLRELLLVCAEHVPAYTFMRHFKPEIEKDPEAALRRFPVFGHAEFRKDTGAYLNDLLGREGLCRFSTNAGVVFYMDAENAARREGERIWIMKKHGVAPQSRHVVFENIPREERTGIFSGQKRVKNRASFTYDDYGNIEKALAQMARFKPEYICGAPSTLYLLAKKILESGAAGRIRMKAAFCYGDTLYPGWEELISSALGCETVFISVTRDFGVIAHTCREGGLHLNEFGRYFEFDRIGGELLMTDLMDFVMPRLREPTGLRGVCDASPCRCGMDTPKLVREYGHNSLRREFSEAILSIQGMRRFQLTFASQSAALKIIAGEGAERKAEELLKGFFPNMETSVEAVERIPSNAAGIIQEFIMAAPNNPERAPR